MRFRLVHQGNRALSRHVVVSIVVIVPETVSGMVGIAEEKSSVNFVVYISVVVLATDVTTH